MSINYYIQYHNADKLGRYPTLNIDFNTSVESLTLDDSVQYGSQIYTYRKIVEKAIGQFCFLIVGRTDKIKKYYLWSFFKIESYEKYENGHYEVMGTGYDFEKPIILNGLEQFDDFKAFCGNFGLGFQNIDAHSFRDTLIMLASSQKTEPSIKLEQDNYLALRQLNEKMKGVEPEKRIAEIEQVLRKDARIVELLKKATNYRCQFPDCTSEIPTKKGLNYVEVAHIKPVHKGGKSVLGNLIVLCPNHHKEFDYGDLNIIEQTDDLLTGTLNGKAFIITQKS